MFLHSVVEAKVDDGDNEPIDERCNGDEVLEPAENYGGGVGERHVAQTDEETQGTGRNIRDTKTVGPKEDLGCVTLAGHSI